MPETLGNCRIAKKYISKYKYIYFTECIFYFVRKCAVHMVFPIHSEGAVTDGHG